MKTILLDRDGVLNPYMPDDYLKSPSQWVWQEKAIDALQILTNKDYRIIVITNQSCINRKIVSYRTVEAIHAKIKAQLLDKDVSNIHFAICHHTNEDNCQCRKPKSENILKVIKAYHLDTRELIFIGDSPSDMTAGQKANIQTIALKTGNPKMVEYLQKTGQIFYSSLFEAVQTVK
jgi:D-glycero-D-manno-heptose 1,7-bisphosphate phosphatase